MPLVAQDLRETIKNRFTPGERLALLFLLVAQRLPLVRNLVSSPFEYLEPRIRANIGPMKLLTLWWLGTMQRYLALHAKGVPMLAVRYETLITQPEAGLRAIFEYCGLPVDEAVVAEGAFAEDSQKNTPLSRDRVAAAKSPLRPELVAQLSQTLLEYPPIQTPDFIVPGTLELDAERGIWECGRK
jgi:hypothetical protein